MLDPPERCRAMLASFALLVTVEAVVRSPAGHILSSLDAKNHPSRNERLTECMHRQGEVERVLSMVDAVLLVVDATEGPMSQTKVSVRVESRRRAAISPCSLHAAAFCCWWTIFGCFACIYVNDLFSLVFFFELNSV